VLRFDFRCWRKCGWDAHAWHRIGGELIANKLLLNFLLRQAARVTQSSVAIYWLRAFATREKCFLIGNLLANVLGNVPIFGICSTRTIPRYYGIVDK